MNWIRDIVTGLIEFYETNNVLDLCDCLGISIIKSELKNKGSLFCRNQLGDEFIFIDSSVNEIDRRTMIAHELGHAILHPDINIAFYDNSLVTRCKWERQANIFAAELLMFDVNELDYIHEGQTLSALAESLEVSESVIEYKHKCRFL